jgi:hypothetical protein
VTVAPPRPRGVGRYPLAGTLGLSTRHAAAELVSAAARERVVWVAGRIPAALTRAAYLECRLRPGPGGDPVDLIFRVEREGAEILAGQHPGVDAGRLLGCGPAWRAVGELCRAWVQGDPAQWGAVRALWLELDLDAPAVPGGPPVPPPSVFVAFDDALTPEMGTDALLALVERVLEPLSPGCMEGDTRARVRGVLDRRPAGAAVPYVGVMLSRARPAVRVYLSRLAGRVVPGLLHELGWPDDQGAEAERVMEALRGLGAPEVGALHLDVLEGALLPRLGVEYTFERRSQMRGRLEERAFLDRLTEAGLCEPERRDALLAWPGYELVRLRHELWTSILARRVNCVKLVHEPDREPQMKAYLLAFHQPYTRRAPA